MSSLPTRGPEFRVNLIESSVVTDRFYTLVLGLSRSQADDTTEKGFW